MKEMAYKKPRKGSGGGGNRERERLRR